MVSRRYLLMAAPWVLAAGFALSPAAEDSPKLLPPDPPSREKRSLDSAAEVALDLAAVVSFLEHGQSYYRAYAKGTHSAAENKAFVRFLEDYERELSTARKELETLRLWAEKKSGLNAGPGLRSSGD